MAEIHKLSKRAQGKQTTIYPVTITDAVVDPSDGHTLTRWLNENKRVEVPMVYVAPDETTLTYQRDGMEVGFKIGDFCRRYSDVQKRYVFYQLYDIANEKADWRVASNEGMTTHDLVVITPRSNQGTLDAALIGATFRITVSGASTEYEYKGSPIEVYIPKGKTCTVVALSHAGYQIVATGSQLLIATFTTAGGETRHFEVPYNTEVVTVNARAFAGYEGDINDAVISIVEDTSGNVLVMDTGNSLRANVAFDTGYRVEVSTLPFSRKPAAQHFIAGQLARTVTIQYVEIESSRIIFDNSIADPANISGDVNAGIIPELFSKFRRCLCKTISPTEAVVTYLDNENSNFYADGTQADLTGGAGEVMVDFPEFWHRCSRIDDNKWCVDIALECKGTSYKKMTRALVGAFPASRDEYTGILHSCKGKYSYGSSPQFMIDVSSPPIGYKLIDVQAHAVIAMILYARFGTRDLGALICDLSKTSQSVHDISGRTVILGNRFSDNTSDCINVLGVERAIGNSLELLSGISVDPNTFIATVTDPEGTTRKIQLPDTDGNVRNIAAEENPVFEALPMQIGGGSSTYYTGFYTRSEVADKSRVVHVSRKIGQVRISPLNPVGLHLTASSTGGASVGTRIMFRGTIRETANVTEFKQL